MLLRLTSSSFGSLFFILSRVSSTSVAFGSSSGTGLYCVGLITPRVTDNREMAHRDGCHFPATPGHQKEVAEDLGDVEAWASRGYEGRG